MSLFEEKLKESIAINEELQQAIASEPRLGTRPAGEKKGGEGKKKKKVCSVGGCSNNAHARGLCTTHCPRKACSIDGCSTKAMARGLCFKHGALGECLREGCTLSSSRLFWICTSLTHIVRHEYALQRYADTSTRPPQFQIQDTYRTL